MKVNRRQLVQTMGAGLCAWQLSACTQPPPAPVRPPLSDEDKALAAKFSVLRGGELIVNSASLQQGVNIFDENGRYFFSKALLGRGTTRMSYGARFGVPKTLHVTWRTGDDVRMQANSLMGGGVIAGDYTVPRSEPDSRRIVAGFASKPRRLPSQDPIARRWSADRLGYRAPAWVRPQEEKPIRQSDLHSPGAHLCRRGFSGSRNIQRQSGADGLVYPPQDR